MGTTVADRYRLEGPLGRGGMADVLVAHDTVLDRKVAIKLLRDAPDSDAARARFVSEARILAGLSHPGLVTVLDAGVSGEQPYLVMELLPGGTVADLIDRGSQPVDRVAQLGGQVAAALVPVHAAGVVHRDVKPSNILIDAWARARLADFGIARLVADNVRATATGTTVGTMAYLAPEQASGGDVGTAADVYSLGLVLLELLTGVPAFTGTATEAALARLTRDPVVPGDLPEALRSVLSEMTDRRPEARPSAVDAAQRLASVAAAATASRAAQAGIATEAVPALAPARVASRAGWSRGRAGALVAAAAVVVATAVGLGFATGRAPAEDAANEPPATSAPSASAAADEKAVEEVAVAAAVTTAAPAHRKQHQQAKPKHGKAKHHKPKHGKPKHHKPKHHKPKHHKPHRQ